MINEDFWRLSGTSRIITYEKALSSLRQFTGQNEELERVHPYQEDDVLYVLAVFRNLDKSKRCSWFTIKDGKVTPGTGGKNKSLYNLENLLQAEEAETIFIVEGEKDVEFLTYFGIVATTSGSATSATFADLSVLKNKKVAICPDNDKPGEEYAVDLKARLCGIVNELSIVDIKALGLGEGGDISDYIQRAWLEMSKELLLNLPRVKEGEWKTLNIESLDEVNDFYERFPVEELPPIFSDVCLAIERETQAPIEIAVPAVLAASALAAQGKMDIRFRGQIYPVSLGFLCFAESGERKSTVLKAVQTPIAEFELAEFEHYKSKKREYQQKLEQEEYNRKKQLKSNGIVVLTNPLEEPKNNRLLVSDFTTEGVEKTLSENRGSIGLFLEEGSVFLGGHSMHRENKTKAIGHLNNLLDGQRIRSTRKGSGALEVERVRTSSLMYFQLNYIKSLFGEDELLEQGFLSRFLPSVAWKSNVGFRQYKQGQISEDAGYVRWYFKLKEILEMQSLKYQYIDRMEMAVDDSQGSIFVSQYNDIESRLKGEYEPIRSLANKAAMHSLKLACLFTFFEDPEARKVRDIDLERAFEIVKYFLRQALNIRKFLESGVSKTNLKSLVIWLVNRDYRVFKVSEVSNKVPNRLRNTELLKGTCEKLAELGFLRAMDEKATVYEVNPNIKFK